MNPTMGSMDCSVTTKASPQLVWKLFCDWEKWAQVSDVYSDIRWIKGEPWTVGSIIQVELLRPLKLTVAHEIKTCRPVESISWTDTMQNVRIDQSVAFTPTAEGGTRIDVHAEFVGPERSVFGFALGEMVTEYNRNWYEKFTIMCDQAAASTAAV